MEETIFPPSPSWNLSEVATVCDKNTFAYGEYMNLVVLQCQPGGGFSLNFVNRAHMQRLTVVGYSPKGINKPMDHHLFSCGDDGAVKLWDIDNLTLVLFHQLHAKISDSAKVVAGSWSPLPPFNIITAADNNTIVSWNVYSRTARSFEFYKLLPNVLKCCPFNSDMIAVGSNSGLVYILNLIGKGQIIYKMRGHDNPVLSVSWCPVPYNIFKPNVVSRDLLLASYSMYKDIHIWRVGSDGRVQITIPQPQQSQTPGEYRNVSKFGALLWKNPYTILSTSMFGELLKWDLKKMVSTSSVTNAKNKYVLQRGVCSLVHSKHLRNVYTLSGEQTGGSLKTWGKLNSTEENVAVAVRNDGDKVEVVNAVGGNVTVPNICVENNAEGDAAITVVDNAEVDASIAMVDNAEVDTAITVVDNAFGDNAGVGGDVTVPNRPTCDENNVKVDTDIVVVDNAEVDTPIKVVDNTEVGATIALVDNAEVDTTIAVVDNAEVDADIAVVDRNGHGGLCTTVFTSSSLNNTDIQDRNEELDCEEVATVDEINQGARKKTSLRGEKNRKSKKNAQSVEWEIIVDEEEPVVWSSSQDRMIFACNYETKTMVHSVSTLAGPAMCADVSPMDPNRIAVGAGEGVVRLWNLSKSSDLLQYAFREKITGKVMCVAWHPKTEGLLAFSTDEGRVGMVDTTSNRTAIQFVMHHRKWTKVLCWGPACWKRGRPAITTEITLYSGGEEDLVQYNPARAGEQPLSIKSMISFPCANLNSIAWKDDGSVALISNRTGLICLVRPPHLDVLTTLHSYSNKLSLVTWHPFNTACDTDISPYCDYFAAAACNLTNDVRIFKVVSSGSSHEIVHVGSLTGHLSEIIHLSWNPHVGGQLATCSLDKTCQVWDAIDQKPIANCFSSEHSFFHFSIWSPLDPDLIISGARNYSLHVWRISKQTNRLPSPKYLESFKKGKKSKAKKLKTANTALQSDEEESHCNRLETIILENSVGRLRKKFKNYLKLNVHNNDPVDSCYKRLKNIDLTEEDLRTDYMVGLKFLHSETSLASVVHMRMQNYVETGNTSALGDTIVYTGDVKKHITEMIENNSPLSEYIVSLAPVVSIKLWEVACRTYAKQLEATENYVRAASYLLMVNEVEQALDMLVDHAFYTEALFMLQLRMPKDTDRLKSILEKYSNSQEEAKHLCKAAEGYILLGDYDKATSLLARTKKLECLRVASVCASVSGDVGLTSSLALETLNQCLDSSEWEMAKSIAEDHPQLKYLHILYTVTKILKTNYVEEETPIEQNLLDHLKIALKDFKTTENYNSLEKNFVRTNRYDDLTKLWTLVSRYLALSALAPTDKLQLQHLIEALHTTNRFTGAPDKKPTLYRLCTFLAPRGLLREGSVFEQHEEHDQKQTSMRSFLCAACIEYLQMFPEDRTIQRHLPELIEDLFHKDNFTYFKNLLEIRQLKNKLIINKKDTSPEEPTISNCSTEVPEEIESEEINQEMDRKSKLADLEREVNLFEETYVAAPELVTQYCRLKDVCHLLMASDQELGTKLLDRIEELWKSDF